MLTEVGDKNMGMALGWAAKKGTILFGHTPGSNPLGYKCGVVAYANLAWRDDKQDGEDGTRLRIGAAFLRIVVAVSWPASFWDKRL
jgi:hypothetical protein